MAPAEEVFRRTREDQLKFSIRSYFPQHGQRFTPNHAFTRSAHDNRAAHHRPVHHSWSRDNRDPAMAYESSGREHNTRARHHDASRVGWGADANSE